MNTQWHLKKYDDGSVFGPVDTETLHDWAAKGEISPYDMLSSDGVKWVAAPELEELQMNWIVEFPDGEMYGPTSTDAIRAFLVDGQLTLDNSIRDATTEEKSPIREHPAFQDFLLAEEAGESVDGETGEEPATQDETDEVEILRQRLGELEETNTKMQAAHEGALAILNQELVTAKTQQQFLRSELDLLKEAAKTEHAAKGASQSQTEIELQRIREQFEILFEINKQLTHNYEVSVAQMNRKIQDTLAKIEQYAGHETKLNEKVAEAAQREADYRKQILSMEKELVKAEQAQAGLLGKYADLNDQLMEYLNKSAAKAGDGKSSRK